jgi:nucleotide-binding universal stress UspA family protein
MKRVLIPLDGSDCSLRAVDYLIAERERRQASDEVEVHLLNVQAALRGDIGQFVGSEQITAYRSEESEKALREARSRLAAAGVHPVAHTGVGHAAEVIAQTADELGCDHIVMGTHGRGALADLLAGSTTVRVVHQARVPVILVK